MNAQKTVYVTLSSVTPAELAYLKKSINAELYTDPDNPGRAEIGPMDSAEYAACKIILRQRFGVTIE